MVYKGSEGSKTSRINYTVSLLQVICSTNLEKSSFRNYTKIEKVATYSGLRASASV